MTVHRQMKIVIFEIKKGGMETSAIIKNTYELNDFSSIFPFKQYFQQMEKDFLIFNALCL